VSFLPRFSQRLIAEGVSDFWIVHHNSSFSFHPLPQLCQLRTHSPPENQVHLNFIRLQQLLARLATDVLDCDLIGRRDVTASV
jgi:hypothetical protein